MNTNQNYAVILSLMATLYSKGSWCGETHIQKTAYILKHLRDVPVNEDFVLYKHGPYSFDLHDVLGDMRGLGFVEIEQKPPYGPRLKVSEIGKNFMDKHFPKQFSAQIAEIAELFKSETVQSLEKLATALYLKLDQPQSSIEERATQLHKIKPHINEEDARLAIEKMEHFA